MQTPREAVRAAIGKVIDGLNAIEADRDHAKLMVANGGTYDQWHVKERKKFTALDCGGSGAFLVEKETGELYNILGYGHADYNKKQKANLGNVLTVEVEELHRRRWNYLR